MEQRYANVYCLVFLHSFLLHSFLHSSISSDAARDLTSRGAVFSRPLSVVANGAYGMSRSVCTAHAAGDFEVVVGDCLEIVVDCCLEVAQV